MMQEMGKFDVHGGATLKQDDQIDLPPGFRFHPTDEELISHYLYKKVIDSTFGCRAIGDVDLNMSEPWDLPYKAKMGEKEWYFFCVRGRKYPTGLRTNRATEAGYWKATGKDKEIFKGKALVGMKKTLVFYRGRAPKGEKSNWVMHEYRLEGRFSIQNLPKSAKNEWVICRVFDKSTSGMKVHVTGISKSDSSSNGNAIGSSSLPPLLYSAPHSGAKSRLVSDMSYVPCFSNQESFDSQRNQGIVDYINNNNPLFSVLMNSSGNNNSVLPRYQYAAPVSAENFQIPCTFVMQDHLRALLESNVSFMRQSFKTEREMISVSQETGLTSDVNPEISSVMANHEMGRRAFDDQNSFWM